MKLWTESVELVIKAPAPWVYAMVSDPGRHRDFDGSGALVEPFDISVTGRPLRVGDHFSMQMDLRGRYAMTSTVIEAEPFRRFAWQSRPHHDAAAWRKAFGGRIWRYDLVPASGESTLVRESWDLSEEPLRPLMILARRQARRSMTASLHMLQDLAARRDRPVHAPGPHLGRDVLDVLEDLERLLDDVDPAQEERPTPCAEFNVLALRRHVLGWLDYFATALVDPQGQDRPDPAAFTAAYAQHAVIGQLKVIVQEALEDEGAGTVNVARLGGSYPVPQVADFLLVEALAHGWDLARATGRAWYPSKQTCEHALTVLQSVLAPEYRGPGLPFGLEVAPGQDTSALHRFLAFSGRDPSWASS